MSKLIQPKPFDRIDPNVINNPIQTLDPIVKTPSNSSSTITTEFFETHDTYFPTLLNETNLPQIIINLKPHMVQPLPKNIKLDLRNINVASVKGFPFFNDRDLNDDLIMLKILQNEFDNKDWSDLVLRDEIDDDKEEEEEMNEVNLDQIFENIYNL
ncbi:unnamed protein product [Candida verbasci]|uniref:Uncharacterized protein n=1 Tax=Candida verbasci TaxID=1227364 RepID=A0A9W4U0V9_9ASCO|nr:unnamed protein product [Candida verbasci]